MRCARCDRPAIPQAVGRTEEGLVVFGWCLDCLRQTRCRDVHVARRARRPSTALDLRPDRPRWPRAGASPLGPASSGEAASRSGALRWLAVGLGAWGASLFLGGAALAIVAGLRQGDALGHGSPILMMFGGGMTAALAAGLGSLAGPPPRLKPPSIRWLKAAQLLAFLAALIILVVGIARHDPRRDVMVVALTSLALAISASARWWELRSRGLTTG